MPWMRFIRLACSVFGLTVMCSAHALAQDPDNVPDDAKAKPAVFVELFTSQGCSSCPPADAVFGEIITQPGIVGLAFHVDYWDYLGWRDTFSDPQFTARQYAYRDYMHSNSVYTPQMVIGGREGVVGSRAGDVHAAIARARATPPGARLGLRMQAGGLVADIRPTGQASVPSGAVVWYASYRRQAQVAIARGENAGRSVTYYNVVRSFAQAGNWSGQDAQQFTLPVAGEGDGIAVWLQDPGDGHILAAAYHEN